MRVAPVPTKILLFCLKYTLSWISKVVCLTQKISSNFGAGVGQGKILLCLYRTVHDRNPVTIYTRGFTAPIRQCSEGLEYPEEAQIGKREAAPRACSIDTRLLASRGQDQLSVHIAPQKKISKGVRHQSQGSQLPNSMALGGSTFQEVLVPQMTCNRKS